MNKANNQQPHNNSSGSDNKESSNSNHRNSNNNGNQTKSKASHERKHQTRATPNKDQVVTTVNTTTVTRTTTAAIIAKTIRITRATTAQQKPQRKCTFGVTIENVPVLGAITGIPSCYVCTVCVPPYTQMWWPFWLRAIRKNNSVDDVSTADAVMPFSYQVPVIVQGYAQHSWYDTQQYYRDT